MSNDEFCRIVDRLKAPGQVEALRNEALRTNKPVLITRAGKPYVELRPRGKVAEYRSLAQRRFAAS